MHEQLRDRFLEWWSDRVCRHPWWTLGITGVITLAAMVYTSLFLGFQSDRNELVSRDTPWNKRFLDWQHSFPGTRDLYIIADAGAAGDRLTPQRKQQVRQLMDQLGTALSKAAFVDAAGGGVVWRFSDSQTSAKAMRLLPMPDFLLQLARVSESGLVVRSSAPASFIANAVAQMQGSGQQGISDQDAAKGIDDFRDMIASMGRVLASPLSEPVPSLASVTGPQEDAGWNYLTTDNGRFYIARLTPRLDLTQLNAMAPAIEGVRAAIAQARLSHPGIDIGLTGIEALEADETDAATSDSTIAGVISFVLILVLLVLSYHSVKTPMLAMIALLVGLAWAFGFTTLAIGHLQVLSVVFAAMLLGISDAYGVHIAAKYELIRHEYPDDLEGFVATMRQCFRTMGPGIITGALTTAAAFLTTCLTDFRGVAEMGLISGVGILLCLLAMFSVYPALMRLFKARHKDLTPVQQRLVQFYSDAWVMPFVRRPKLTLALALLLSMFSAAATSQMHFDFDLMRLQAEHAPSVVWARKLIQEGEQSVYSGISIARDLQEARARAKQFEALSTVDRVAGIGLLFPQEEARKLELIQQARKNLGVEAALGSVQPQATGDVLGSLAALRLQIAAAALLQPPKVVQDSLNQLASTVDAVLANSRGWPEAERAQRLARLDAAYQAMRQTVLQALDPSPLTASDLPAEILRPYLASKPGDTRVAIEVFPKVPDAAATGIDSALHPKFLPHFISDMRSVDPNVTGVIVQIHESGSMIRRAYVVSGWLALALVFVMVLLDFRSVTYALMSLAPVAMGFAVTFGVMYLVGMQINAANIIVLPLMFGIGVDSGVHILHRYLQDPVTRPLGLSHGTGKAITITALTTIVGFAALMIAQHRGIASLGFVLTLGLSCTLIACLIVMPAWLELLPPRQPAVRKGFQAPEA